MNDNLIFFGIHFSITKRTSYGLSEFYATCLVVTLETSDAFLQFMLFRCLLRSTHGTQSECVCNRQMGVITKWSLLTHKLNVRDQGSLTSMVRYVWSHFGFTGLPQNSFSLQSRDSYDQNGNITGKGKVCSTLAGIMYLRSLTQHLS
jgi:hypothetical protein